jgi:site-specific recombinase XerD
MLYKILRRACDRAGVKDVHVYAGTRHSVASQAANRGVPVQKIGAVLGHRDLKSTLRYAHLDVSSLREVVICPEAKAGEILKFGTERNRASRYLSTPRMKKNSSQ